MKTLGFIVNPIAGMGENKISKREAFRTVKIWQCEKPIAKIQGKLKGSRRGAILYVSVHAHQLLRRRYVLPTESPVEAELFSGLL